MTRWQMKGSKNTKEMAIRINQTDVNQVEAMNISLGVPKTKWRQKAIWRQPTTLTPHQARNKRPRQRRSSSITNNTRTHRAWTPFLNTFNVFIPPGYTTLPTDSLSLSVGGRKWNCHSRGQKEGREARESGKDTKSEVLKRKINRWNYRADLSWEHHSQSEQ